MEKIPQFAVELIYALDKAIPYIEFPCTLEGLEDLSEKKIRRLAFLAGQRALVDDLLTLIKEDEDAGDDGSHSGGDNPRGLGGGFDVLSEPTGESATGD